MARGRRKPRETTCCGGAGLARSLAVLSIIIGATWVGVLAHRSFTGPAQEGSPRIGLELDAGIPFGEAPSPAAHELEPAPASASRVSDALQAALGSHRSRKDQRAGQDGSARAEESSGSATIEGVEKADLGDAGSPGEASEEWPLFLEGHDLRGLRCRPDWQAHAGDSVCVSEDGTSLCPTTLTPETLTSAEGGRQHLCTRADTHFCTVACAGPDKPAAWSASECEKGRCVSPQQRAKLIESSGGGPGLRGAGELDHEAGKPIDKATAVNLRGLECELKEGKEVCFRAGASGDREICPEHVTSSYLTKGAGQWLCLPEAPATHYCTVACQEGNDEVRWGAHEVAWCEKNPGSCPPRPELIPQDKFRLKKWSAKPRAPRPCEKRAVSAARIGGVSFGILTNGARELRTFADTMATYEEKGLLQRAEDVMVFVNKRDEAIDALLQPFVDRYSPRLRVMGDKKNHGITWALNWLAGNATQPHLLFLEKDFHLVEPVECAREQLETGVRLIEEGTAHAVRYRSRHRPGRPNWAEMMFRGDEERVFRQQPNLFCNHYYWIADPELRWPDKIWRCLEQPTVFYCSKAEFCNWTNNPTLISTAWWEKEYVKGRFPKATRHDPYEHLEMYMNWEPGSWNDEPFVVAQGDGLFKHVDRNNFA